MNYYKYLSELSTNGNLVLSDKKYPFTYAYNGDKIQTITVMEKRGIRTERSGLN